MVAKDVEYINVGDYVEIQFDNETETLLGRLLSKEVVEIGDTTVVQVNVSGLEVEDDPRDNSPVAIRRITAPFFDYGIN